jgi:uncharacterized protein
VIVKIAELSGEVRRADFRASASALNASLAAGGGMHLRFDEDPEVVAEIYRHGTDVYFCGSVRGRVVSECPRCSDEFAWTMEREFKFLIVKEGGSDVPEEDTGLDHYSGDEIDLAPLAGEQAILGLDETVLCSESCKGLCSQCGANLNSETCDCRSVNPLNPFAALRRD